MLQEVVEKILVVLVPPDHYFGDGAQSFDENILISLGDRAILYQDLKKDRESKNNTHTHTE